MKRQKLSNAQLGTINIIGCIFVVVINMLINFFLSPFIVEHLGVEANGYVTLANNFISYMAIITTALNSMCGRFIMIDLRKGDLYSANQYYSSVLFGDWMLGGTLLCLSVIFVWNLESFIQVDAALVRDVKILFSITFANFFLPLLVPKWLTATYITNHLYLRSLKSVVSSMIRAVCIVVAYACFPPAAYFVAIAGAVMTVVNLLFEYAFKTKLTPELKVNFSLFSMKKVITLLSSGIWNSVSKCGTILLEGLDLLVANIFIDATSMGILSVSKIIPNMINQVISSITSTLTPNLIYLYADGRIKEIQKKVGQNIKIVSLLSAIPMGIIFIYGKDFFQLWVPTLHASQLAILASLSMCGIVVAGIASCVTNIFSVFNRLRTNALVVILSGVLNVGIVFVLLKVTDWGIYVIAGVSPIVTILRILVFTLPYAAHCLRAPILSFHLYLLKGLSMVLVPCAISILMRNVFVPGNWIMFALSVLVVAFISLGILMFIALNHEERTEIKKVFKKNKK